MAGMELWVVLLTTVALGSGCQTRSFDDTERFGSHRVWMLSHQPYLFKNKHQKKYRFFNYIFLNNSTAKRSEISVFN